MTPKWFMAIFQALPLNVALLALAVIADQIALLVIAAVVVVVGLVLVPIYLIELGGRERSPPICSTRGRINIFERWESQAARETFRSSGPDKKTARGDAHGGGSGVHRRRAARVRRTHSMSCRTGRCHDR